MILKIIPSITFCFLCAFGSLSCGSDLRPKSHLQMLGKDSFEAQPGVLPEGIVSLMVERKVQTKDRIRSKGRSKIFRTNDRWLGGCGGAYIAEGVVMTAKHCLKKKKSSTLYRLTIRFPGLEQIILNLDDLHIIPHPKRDLALVSFAPSLLQASPTPLELFSLPPGSTPPPFYTGARFYGLGNVNKHPDYHDPSKPTHFRGVQNLYVLTHSFPSGTWKDYFHAIKAHPITKTYLTFTHLNPCFSEHSLGPPVKMMFEALCTLFKKTHVLVATANLVLPTHKAPHELREVLFCNGDSGSPLLSADGRVLGMHIQSPMIATNKVTYPHQEFIYDSIAVGTLGCRHLGYSLDMLAHKNWIQKHLQDIKNKNNSF